MELNELLTVSTTLSKWTMPEALGLIRKLQPEVKKFGYHLTLGGGVLNKGESDKDLDIYLITMDSPKFKRNMVGLVEWLEGLWGKATPLSKPKGANQQLINQLQTWPSGWYETPTYSALRSSVIRITTPPSGTVVQGSITKVGNVYSMLSNDGMRTIYYVEAIPGSTATVTAQVEEYPDDPTSVYKKKLKFNWDGLRIDVFIVGE